MDRRKRTFPKIFYSKAFPICKKFPLFGFVPKFLPFLGTQLSLVNPPITWDFMLDFSGLSTSFFFGTPGYQKEMSVYVVSPSYQERVNIYHLFIFVFPLRNMIVRTEIFPVWKYCKDVFFKAFKCITLCFQEQFSTLSSPLRSDSQNTDMLKEIYFVRSSNSRWSAHCLVFTNKTNLENMGSGSFESIYLLAWESYLDSLGQFDVQF